MSKRILILGSSYIHRLETYMKKRKKTEVNAMFDLYKEDDLSIKLYGVGGLTCESLLRNHLHIIGDFSPDLVVLHVGGNDLCNQTPQDAHDSIIRVINLIQEKHQVKQIIISSILQRQRPSGFAEKADILNHLLQMTAANMKNIRFWKHKRFNKPELIHSDRVHLSDLGNYQFYRSLKFAIVNSLRLL